MAKKRKRATVRILGYDVVPGTKRHEKLLTIKKHADDLQRSETGRGRENPTFSLPRNRWIKGSIRITSAGKIQMKKHR